MWDALQRDDAATAGGGDTMARNTDRVGFTTDQRIALAEQDLDRFEQIVEGLRKALNRQTAVFIGAIISFSTAAIILAWQINLAGKA